MIKVAAFVREWGRVCLGEYGVLGVWYFPTGLLRAAFYAPILRWHERDRDK
jgi:hypothetical protein